VTQDILDMELGTSWKSTHSPQVGQVANNTCVAQVQNPHKPTSLPEPPPSPQLFLRHAAFSSLEDTIITRFKQSHA
jgi:hypothetical protein